jgi:hypothetical protein
MLIKVLIALVIIGALALGGFFYKDYLDQNAKAADLETQLKNTNNSAVVVSRQAQSIETEIADIVKRSSDAQKAINAEKNTLTDRINSNTIVRSILVLGQTMGVKVIPLNTQDWAAVKVGSHDYSVFRMSIQASGDPKNIVEFLRSLQGSVYQTLVIENVNLDKSYVTPEPDPTITPAPEVTPIPSVTSDIKFAIYAR